MQAIILAAGMGRRLKELTKHNTKCMIKVGGVTLIERLLKQLEPYQLSRIVIVFGYKGKKLVDYVDSLDIKTPITYVENPIYNKTNNIYSLYLAKDRLAEDDTLLFESDLIFEDSVIKTIINDPRPTLALVDKYESWMDGTCVRLTQNDEIADFISGNKLRFSNTDDYYKTVNVYKFSKHFSQAYYIPFLEAYCTALGYNEYYEQVLKVIAMLNDSELRALRLSGQSWYEIDDIQDLDIAESIFSGGDKLGQIQSRYGGYWRYPKLIDFCYLVNPFYPPSGMIEELKASFDTLIRNYPSGMKVNSLLASKKFGVSRNYIVIGNGAAELIKSLCSTLSGNVGIIRPTFEEYPNRLSEDRIVAFTPNSRDFAYSADDIMAFFGDKQINSLVLINPDNPSGNYISHCDVLRLAEWALDKDIRLIADESFVDFADERNATLIRNDILEAYKNLVVVKSISKCYGIPGLRLGVLCSADERLIDFIKKDVGIWNINSVAEFYMQIEEKYKDDYENALRLFRAERARFHKRLAAIKGVHVVPSQANYFMLAIDANASEVVDKLLARNIFIKDLTAKTGGDHLRVAIRNQSDNDKLADALASIMNEQR